MIIKEKFLKKISSLSLLIFFLNIFTPVGVMPQKVYAAGNTYYVATYGNDSNDGSLNSPWKTIQKACNTLKPGDTVLVRGGTYNERITMGVSGSELEGYVTIKNYPNERPVIDGTGKSGAALLNMNGKSYIHFEGFEMKNIKQTWAYGIYMSNSETNIKIINNEISNIECLDPTSSNNGANAIILFGNKLKPISNILIKGNYVHDLVTGWCEAISVASNCEYVDIIENRVDNTGNIGIDIVGNFGYCPDKALDQPRYCTAVGNVISNCNSPNATSAGLYTDGGRDILFDRNIIFNSQIGIEVGAEERVPGYPCKNVIVTNNLVYNNSSRGIAVGGYTTTVGTVENVKIYNNTMVNNGRSELVIEVADNVDVRNNIMYKDYSGYLVNNSFDNTYTKNLNFKNNLYYSTLGDSGARFKLYNTTITGFANWLNASKEVSALFSNPAFKDISTNNYSLRETSMAINKGDSAITIGTLDLAGNNRVKDNIDCGAYEYSGEISGGEPEVIPVSQVSLDKTSVSLFQGQSITLMPMVLPSNATNQNVIWTTSNKKVATVEGGIVTAKARGTAIITVTTLDGSKTATCIVTVSKTK